MDRLDLASPDEAAAIADGAAAARSATFYGWAVVMARQAGTNGREVKASAKPDNPCHADIVLPSFAVEDRDVQITHAQELADNSSWRERPTTASDQS